MQTSLLIKLYSSIQPNEKRALEKYLFGRFSQDSELGKLHKYIKKHHKTGSAKKLLLENANSSLFKNKTRKNFSNLMSVLTGHFRSYFIQLQLNKKELLQNALLIEELNSRNLYEEATNVYLDTEKKEDKWKIGLMSGLYKQMIYHQLYFSYNPVKRTEEGTILFKKIIKHLQLATDSIATLLEFEEQSRRISKRQNYLEIDDYQFNSEYIPYLIKSFQKIMLEEDQKEFENTLKKFYSHFSDWDENLQNLAFQVLKTHLSIGVKNGVNELADYVKFSKYSISIMGISFKGFRNFSNSVSLYECAVMEGDYEWADFILSKVREAHLQRKDSNSLRLFMAMHHFSKKRFEDSLIIINELNKLEKMEKSSVRKWQLMCYAELYPDDFNFLNTQYINYISFLNRTKNHYNDFILDGEKSFATLWKALFLNKDIQAAQLLLDQKIPCAKRYFFIRKIKEAMDS